ncbi:extracellular solute-binding protein [Nonomuraea sp. PA05]|uniref:ABC transporter substrate-binding protein n=1 Tax=Nonomuraea sp. PA05 TaxID=2604466 RepID=UPI0011D5B874|nr:extracellular solute-binding protein [Nonomuraea sp. PA05]TYB71116.1 extracellular solute-binding protein [Nonomuraea sp. PA05]
MTPPSLPSLRRARRRTILGAAALAVALTASLAACSSGDTTSGSTASASGPVTLEFWTWSLKGSDAAAQAIADKYHQLHPNVTVKLSEVGGTTETAAKLLAADQAGDTPDVVQIEYRGLPALVVAGAAKDITADVAGVKGNVDPNVWAQTTFGNQVYGVPQDIGPMVLTYRQDLFDKFGIKVPTTWDEYADAAEQIREKDPDAYIASFAANQLEFFAAHAAQANAQWWSTDGNAWKVGIDSEASLKTADFWQDLVERDLVKVEPLLTPEWNAKVNDGKILSWTAGAWAPSVIYSVAPDTAGKWASAPLPQWTKGQAAVPFLGGSAYLVPAKSQHAKEAAAFAAWLGASDEGSKLLLGLDLFPGANAGRQATLTHEPPKLMPQQKDFYQVTDQVIKNTTIPVTWGPNVNIAQTAFGDALNKAALDKTSFRAVYQATQQAVVADLQKSGYTVTK